MYGTVARLRVKPGMEQRLRQLSREFEEANIPGYLFEIVYRTDADSNEYMLAVGFESREAYQANASNPAQHQRYLQYLELLDGEPEWHDGEIVYTYRK